MGFGEEPLDLLGVTGIAQGIVGLLQSAIPGLSRFYWGAVGLLGKKFKSPQNKYQTKCFPCCLSEAQITPRAGRAARQCP